MKVIANWVLEILQKVAQSFFIHPFPIMGQAGATHCDCGIVRISTMFTGSHRATARSLA